MTKIDNVSIASRFCGPPDSGNGGYSVGLLAREFDYRAEVTLRMPPPLDTPMSIKRVRIEHGGEIARMLDGDHVVGEAAAWQGELTPPAMIPGQDAAHAAQSYAGFHHHHFPSCFVCGPERGEGDGLRIFPGASGHGNVFAAPWTPSESLADADGKIDPLFIAAALDCPGYFSLAMEDKALLGRMALHISGSLRLGETAIVVAHKEGEEGRKRFASTAIYGQGGNLVAASRQVWIVLK